MLKAVANSMAFGFLFYPTQISNWPGYTMMQIILSIDANIITGMEVN
jgi:hypothetical protein